MKTSIFFLSVALILVACDKNRFFDRNETLAIEGWAYHEVKQFEVTISDTTVFYNLYINVRHTDEYQFSNLWLKINTIFPDSSRLEKDVNVELAESNGNFTGNCLDGICYTSVLIQSNVAFIQAGNYTFLIEQDMRLNPIQNLLNIGIKLEKISAY